MIVKSWREAGLIFRCGRRAVLVPLSRYDPSALTPTRLREKSQNRSCKIKSNQSHLPTKHLSDRLHVRPDADSLRRTIEGGVENASPHVSRATAIRIQAGSRACSLHPTGTRNPRTGVAIYCRRKNLQLPFREITGLAISQVGKWSAGVAETRYLERTQP